jgi:fibronectin type 3 domain-containing protein
MVCPKPPFHAQEGASVKHTKKSTKSKSTNPRILKLVVTLFGALMAFSLMSCSMMPSWDFTFSGEEGEEGGEEQSTPPGDEYAEVMLEWDENTEPDLDGYKLYYGSASRSYGYIIDVGNQTDFTVVDLVEGETYYFAVTAYNTSGYESSYSNEVVYTVPTGS